MKINFNKTIITLGVCALTGIVFADDQVAQYSQRDRHDMDKDNQPLTPQSFVWKAATIDLKEIHTAELALQKSDNSDVKSFAKRIVADHRKDAKKLQSMAEKEGWDFPNTNSMAWDMNDRWHTNSSDYAGHANDRWHTNNNYETHSLPASDPDKDSPPHLATMLTSTNMTHDHDVNNMQEREMNPGMALSSLSGAEFDRAFASHMVDGHQKAIHLYETAPGQDASLKKYADKTLPTLRDHLRMAEELQSKVGGWSNSPRTNSMSKNNYQNR